MMADRRIEIDAVWNGAKLQSGINQSKSSLASFGAAAKRLLPVLGVTGGIYGAITGLKQAFADLRQEQQENKRLQATLIRQGIDYENEAKRISETMIRLRRSTPFGDTEITSALQTLTVLTGNYEESLKNLDIVLDVATDRKMSLADASRTIAFVQAGELTQAGRLIPALRQVAQEYAGVADRSLKASIGLSALRKQFGGAAQADLENSATATKKLSQAMKEFRDSLIELIGSGEKAEEVINHGALAVDQGAENTRKHHEALQNLLRTMWAFSTSGASELAIHNFNKIADAQERNIANLKEEKKWQDLVNEALAITKVPVNYPPYAEDFAGTIFAKGAKGRPQRDPYHLSELENARAEFQAMQAHSEAIRHSFIPTERSIGVIVEDTTQINAGWEDFQARLHQSIIGAAQLGQVLQGTISGALITGAQQGGQAMVAYLKDLFVRELFTNLAAGILNVLSGGTMGQFSILGQAIGLGNGGLSAGPAGGGIQHGVGPRASSIQQQQLWRLQRG
jgi:hypothetical protein